ncbi:gp164 [uncultured Mediterranean phage uvMED]|nr:gp164 [uncultured Mediterranean phage uvMED]
MPPQSIPSAPPITLQIGFPVADLPGCIETRNAQAGNEKAYSNDPRGNVVVCDGTMPSYKPLDFTPGTLTYKRAKPPAIDLDVDTDVEKPAEVSSQPGNESPVLSDGLADFIKVATELPCPPPDAIPIGAKNKSQTAVIIGYKRNDEGRCEAIYEPLGVPTIIGNYLPGAPVVATTATIAAVATTAAIFAKPLGDFLLKAVKPTVKKVIKKIKEKLGKKVAVESVLQRRKNQRALRK